MRICPHRRHCCYDKSITMFTSYTPCPAEVETLRGQLLFLQNYAKRINSLPLDHPHNDRPSLQGIASSISEFNDPTVIPYLIAVLDMDSNRRRLFLKRNSKVSLSSCLTGFIPSSVSLRPGNSVKDWTHPPFPR